LSGHWAKLQKHAEQCLSTAVVRTIYFSVSKPTYSYIPLSFSSWPYILKLMLWIVGHSDNCETFWSTDALFSIYSLVVTKYTTKFYIKPRTFCPLNACDSVFLMTPATQWHYFSVHNWWVLIAFTARYEMNDQILFRLGVARVRLWVSYCEICRESGTGTSFPLSTWVFPCQYHSTSAPLSTRCSYQKDRQVKPGNLSQSNALPETGKQWIEKNFYFFSPQCGITTWFCKSTFQNIKKIPQAVSIVWNTHVAEITLATFGYTAWLILHCLPADRN
jgi:hypothetical protein